MANRYGFQFRYSLVPVVWELFAKITIGALGEPTLVAANSLGIASVSRTSAGLYLITLTDVWTRLMGVNATFVASGGAAAPDVSVNAEDVDGAKTISINTQAGGVNADPASGEILLLQIILKNTSLQG